MNLKKIISKRKKIRDYLIGGAIFGVLYASAEYFIRLKTGDDPQQYVPLLIRASFMGSFIMGSILIFEIILKELV